MSISCFNEKIFFYRQLETYRSWCFWCLLHLLGAWEIFRWNFSWSYPKENVWALCINFYIIGSLLTWLMYSMSGGIVYRLSSLYLCATWDRCQGRLYRNYRQLRTCRLICPIVHQHSGICNFNVDYENEEISIAIFHTSSMFDLNIKNFVKSEIGKVENRLF